MSLGLCKKVFSHTLQLYQILDINIYQENLLLTNMILKKFGLDNYLFKSDKNKLNNKEQENIEKLIQKEII